MGIKQEGRSHKKICKLPIQHDQQFLSPTQSDNSELFKNMEERNFEQTRENLNKSEVSANFGKSEETSIAEILQELFQIRE